jgi:DNA invertase Pin-like site-specific DNA recombinase
LPAKLDPDRRHAVFASADQPQPVVIIFPWCRLAWHFCEAKFCNFLLDQNFQCLTVCVSYLRNTGLKMAIIGYARVSARDQNLAGQMEALKAAGAGTIYREKVSGARADRPQLAKLMAGLRAGDVVVVTKLDRLGRSTRELLDLIDRIGKVGASFRSLGDPLWDTSSAQGRVLSTLLASIAEFERELIRERTGEGRKRAMAAGVKFGRKRKLSDYQRAEAIKRRAAGETLASIARSYGVHLAMISRL